MSGMTFAVLMLLAVSATTLPFVAMWRRRRPRLPRQMFLSCWIQEDRIVAEGRLAPSVILFDHMLLSINGNDIEMVVMEVDPTGGRWAAQDLVSLRAKQLVGR